MMDARMKYLYLATTHRKTRIKGVCEMTGIVEWKWTKCLLSTAVAIV